MPGLTHSNLGITAEEGDCQPPVFIAQRSDFHPKVQLVTFKAKLSRRVGHLVVFRCVKQIIQPMRRRLTGPLPEISILI